MRGRRLAPIEVPSPADVPRYRFDEFTLSPRRRLLLRNGREVPLIPRYFDLLVLLVERRGEAVHRRDIFDRIWADVVVSDSALSQAIRTIRRTLDDDSREPRFVRTVSRHGYRFVFADVVEEEDVDEHAPRQAVGAADARTGTTLGAPGEPVPTLPAESLDEAARGATLSPPGSVADPEHAASRAPAGQAALSPPRWLAAARGAGAAGLLAGVSGAAILMGAPGSVASFGVVPVLGAIGGCCGAGGGAGVGAGLTVAESLAGGRNAGALVAGAAIGGGIAGAAVQWLGRWTLAALVGVHLDTGGAVEGLVIGAAAGCGLALRNTIGAPTAAPAVTTHPPAEWPAAAVILTCLTCALAALALALAGRPLVGGTIHAIARASAGAQVTLTPLANLIGEPEFGRLTAALLATGEGAMFGAGLAIGLRSRDGRDKDRSR